MSEALADKIARDRFRSEWQCNFAVSANAGSGKTTAISERLAEMALSPEGAAALQKTAVVTYTKKAAAQIGQRAREVLLRRIGEAGRRDLHALDQLERVFFGTIHSFCLLLAQRYGQSHGLNLNPRLLAEDSEEADVLFEEFITRDGLDFSSLTQSEVKGFLRFMPMEALFPAVRRVGTAVARQLACRRPSGPMPRPGRAILEQILELSAKGSEQVRKNLLASQREAAQWMERFEAEQGFVGIYKPQGTAKNLAGLATAWMAPLKDWLSDAAAVLTAELADRYRVFRGERGVQTYADQIDTALQVLQDRETLDRIRRDGWRVILDEAQDTDSQQFSILVEITRPVGAEPGTWPGRDGAPPRPGHFCLVGDGQQAIYRARADIRNFVRHVDAYGADMGGEKLAFQVTFRAPRSLVRFLNSCLPESFGCAKIHNMGLPPGPGAPAPRLQVDYEPLVPAPGSPDGAVEVFALTCPGNTTLGVKDWMREEARQLGEFLAAHGPVAVGADDWSDVCVLAPRYDWLALVQTEFLKAGLNASLQNQRGRAGDNPAYAWLLGLMAVVCNPSDDYEWFGVLREVFAVSDDLLARERRARGSFQWDDPQTHPEPMCSAMQAVRKWMLRVDDEGLPLDVFAQGLAADCQLRERAQAVDASGAAVAELDRLLAQAAELGLEGYGPRRWFAHLLAGREDLRPTGRPQRGAINLLTSHSAKGLEWPVVITVGFWRQIGEAPSLGFLVAQEGSSADRARLYLSASEIPADTLESRQRERVRELVRLLYVTLTRARRRLIIAWGPDFGRRRGADPSFADLFGSPELLGALPVVSPGSPLGDADGEPALNTAIESEIPAMKANPMRVVSRYPARILPHQLSGKTDHIRTGLHETALDQMAPGRQAAGDEAIDYGVWWHETMEHTPWRSGPSAIESRWAVRLEEARAKGFHARALEELDRLRASEAWAELCSGRWKVLAELALLAPIGPDAWIDGVVDLVMHDVVRGKIWVVDWKTNHPRHAETGALLLGRLAQEYAPQLQAYGKALAAALPDQVDRLLLYSSAAGDWKEVPSGQD